MSANQGVRGGRRLFLVLCVVLPASALALEPKVDIWTEGGSYPVVHGKTNLPDGTRLSITLKIFGRYGSTQTAEVEGGTFSSDKFTVEGEGPIPPGTAIIEVVSALPALQPESVRMVIGQSGENMVGPLAFTLPGLAGRMIKVSSERIP